MNDKENKSFRPSVLNGAKVLGILIPVAVLCAGFILGLCWFLRPAESETEKRELTKFPAFTVESFLSGEFTDQVSLWYADTFPAVRGSSSPTTGSSPCSVSVGSSFSREIWVMPFPRVPWIPIPLLTVP